jgi:SAM-dependent methyltransferase
MEPDEYERIFRLETTHFWYRALHSLVFRLAARHARPAGRASAAILDAGCGTGGLAARLAAVGCTTAIDLSPIAIGLAARRGQARLARGDVAHLPFRDGSFDFIVSTDVLYHRAVEDDKAALAEIARACRPGGYVCLTLAAHEWLRSPHDRVVHTARRYTRRRVREIAVAAGLEVVRLSYFNCALLPVAIVSRLAVRRSADTASGSDLRPVPAILNAVLTRLLGLEARLVTWTDLPFGLSILALLRKPEPPTRDRVTWAHTPEPTARPATPPAIAD